MKAKEILEKYKIRRETLSRWVKSGKIMVTKTPTGRYNYDDGTILKPNLLKKVNIIYARVSSSGQKENLDRQIERLKLFASAKGIIIDKVIHEVASALNYNRTGYRKLFKLVCECKVDKIIIEYKDRLLRIGFDDFEELCRLFNVTLIVIDNSEIKTKNQEIVEDLVSIVHNFSTKIYSSRKRKKILDVIQEEDEQVVNN